MTLERTVEAWAHLMPEAVVDGSKAQIINALRDAKRDIATLSGRLRSMSLTAVGAEKEADEAYKENRRLRVALAEIAEFYEKNYVEGDTGYQGAIAARSALHG